LVDLHQQIAHDLERRQHSLPDPNGRLQLTIRSLENRTRTWTEPDRQSIDPSEGLLELDHVASYIVNCPRLHPLTRSMIKRLLDDADEGSGIEVWVPLTFFV
jgi:hypothetical protein